ncbi:MAG TPA: DUF2269 family protein [Solirubrobacteraceae bacterium]|jgi:hypothetical protein|nr:DUF2269 family protein [Solirubrobacteraceae bacterium]
MSWYELLLTLHLLSMATWFGSSLAITAMGFMSLKTGPEAFGTFTLPATRWAGRAHPVAGVVLLLTGFAMVADRDWSFDAWLILAVIGLVVAMAIGGALIGRTADGLVKRLEDRSISAEELTGGARQLLLYTRIELVVLVLVVADMVAKPGL